MYNESASRSIVFSQAFQVSGIWSGTCFLINALRTDLIQKCRKFRGQACQAKAAVRAWNQTGNQVKLPALFPDSCFLPFQAQ
jgi:hypothetical protein